MEQEETPLELNRSWTIWFDKGGARGQTRAQYESGITALGTFSSVQDFWRYWNAIFGERQKLPDRCNLLVFQHDIKPTWEDPANASGGCWTIQSPSKTASQKLATNIVLEVIGEMLPGPSDDVCGVVVRLRHAGDTVAVWNRSPDVPSVAQTTAHIRTVVESLNLDPEGAVPAISYQSHRDAMNVNQKFKSSTDSPNPSTPSRSRLRVDVATAQQQQQQQHTGLIASPASTPLSSSLPSSPLCVQVPVAAVQAPPTGSSAPPEPQPSPAPLSQAPQAQQQQQQQQQTPQKPAYREHRRYMTTSGAPAQQQRQPQMAQQYGHYQAAYAAPAGHYAAYAGAGGALSPRPPALPAGFPGGLAAVNPHAAALAQAEAWRAHKKSYSADVTPLERSVKSLEEALPLLQRQGFAIPEWVKGAGPRSVLVKSEAPSSAVSPQPASHDEHQQRPSRDSAPVSQLALEQPPELHLQPQSVEQQLRSILPPMAYRVHRKAVSVDNAGPFYNEAAASRLQEGPMSTLDLAHTSPMMLQSQLPMPEQQDLLAALPATRSDAMLLMPSPAGGIFDSLAVPPMQPIDMAVPEAPRDSAACDAQAPSHFGDVPAIRVEDPAIVHAIVSEQQQQQQKQQARDEEAPTMLSAGPKHNKTPSNPDAGGVLKRGSARKLAVQGSAGSPSGMSPRAAEPVPAPVCVAVAQQPVGTPPVSGASSPRVEDQPKPQLKPAEATRQSEARLSPRGSEPAGQQKAPTPQSSGGEEDVLVAAVASKQKRSSRALEPPQGAGKAVAKSKTPELCNSRAVQQSPVSAQSKTPPPSLSSKARKGQQKCASEPPQKTSLTPRKTHSKGSNSTAAARVEDEERTEAGSKKAKATAAETSHAMIKHVILGALGVINKHL
eukprot:m51a1_g6419 hypothetical protein (887) ;mRNA; f:300925-304593